MSIAIEQAGLRASETWRRFQWACAIVAGLILIGCVFYVVETFVLDVPRRFAENPAETVMRAAGLAHFSIGWLFLFTSPRLRNRPSLVRLAGCTLFGIGFCALYAWGGADKNPLCLIAYYGFFFVHETYDEAHLFQRSADAPLSEETSRRFIGSLALSVSLTFLFLLSAFHLVRGPMLGRFGTLPAGVSQGLWTATALSVLAAAFAWAESWRRAAPWPTTLATYRPLLAVYAGLVGILLVGSCVGSIGYNFIIILHGIMWLLFTCERMSERPYVATNPWTWVRHTPAGLITLHVGLAVIALVLFALRTHVWNRTGLVCDLVSRGWFPYWAIMHIAMSLWRK